MFNIKEEVNKVAKEKILIKFGGVEKNEIGDFYDVKTKLKIEGVFDIKTSILIRTMKGLKNELYIKSEDFNDVKRYFMEVHYQCFKNKSELGYSVNSEEYYSVQIMLRNLIFETFKESSYCKMLCLYDTELKKIIEWSNVDRGEMK